MRQALRDNKVSFVKLLLNNGVVMKNMINPKVLRELYNAVSFCVRPSRELTNWANCRRVHDQINSIIAFSNLHVKVN